MKKINGFILFTILFAVGVGNPLLAQDKSPNDSTESRTYGSLLWGLYTWGDDERAKSDEVENNGLAVEADEEPSFDTTRYELKSILGGAVQWTERKPTAGVQDEE